jgi:hypothetical protein
MKYKRVDYIKKLKTKIRVMFLNMGAYASFILKYVLRFLLELFNICIIIYSGVFWWFGKYKCTMLRTKAD